MNAYFWPVVDSYMSGYTLLLAFNASCDVFLLSEVCEFKSPGPSLFRVQRVLIQHDPAVSNYSIKCLE